MRISPASPRNKSDAGSPGGLGKPTTHRFNESDQQRALSKTHRVYCGNRPMRTSTAIPKNKSGATKLAIPMGHGDVSVGDDLDRYLEQDTKQYICLLFPSGLQENYDR